jgi:hypothetical protein
MEDLPLLIFFKIILQNLQTYKMKKGQHLIILIIFTFSFSENIYAQIGINATGAAPANNAMLDISSTTKGLLIPRMTTLERNALTPIQGLTVFDITVNGYFFHNGTSWQQLLTTNANSPWLTSGNDIFNSNTGKVGIGTSTPNAKLDILHAGGIGVNVKSASSVSTVDIDGASGGAELRFVNAGNLKWKLDNMPSTNDLEVFEFGASNVNRLLLQSNTGNLGIGQSNPTSKLDILHTNGTGFRLKSSVGNSMLNIDSFNGESVLQFLKNGNQTWLLRNDPTTDNLDIFEDGLNRRMVIQNNTGNVGINIANPQGTLHVKKVSGVTPAANFEGTTYSSTFNYGLAENTFISGGLANSETHINLTTTGNVSIATGGGKVGIGTSTIATNERMEINGRLRLKKDTFTAGLWLNNAANGTALSDGAFMGLSNDAAGSEKVGFWLNGAYRWEVDRAGNTNQNSVTASNLAGSGTRAVATDANGKLVTRSSESYSLGGLDFQPGSNLQTYTKDFNTLIPDGGSDVFYAPIHLPHGATATSITFYFTDGSPNFNLKFSFYGYNLANANPTNVFATYTTTGSAPLSIQNSGSLTINIGGINNNSAYYYISATPVDNAGVVTGWPIALAGQGTLSIKGASIAYSY